MPRGMEDSRKALSKRAGENAEAATIEAIPALEWVPDSEAQHYDARTVDVVSASDELPLVGRCVLDPQTPIEIKSVSVVYGENQRRGRFHLRKTQHERLMAEGGVYLFAVCEPRMEREILAMKVVDAIDASELVQSWIRSDDRPPYSKFAWTRVFDPTEVENA